MISRTSAAVDSTAYLPAEEYPRLKDVIPPAVLALLPLVLALVLWASSLPNFDLLAMTDLGLNSILPARFILALAILILGFCATLARANENRWAPAAYVATWVVVIHGTPAILYGSLRYAWAWKHVGIVDYIQRTGQVDTTIASMPVYHNWPGFFGAAAVLVESAGMRDALLLASWAPLYFELLFAAGILLILRSASPDWRVAWLGVWVFTLTNWVGQDYFAPQAMTYLFYLVVIGICLWAFPGRPRYSSTPIGQWMARWKPLARILAAVDQRLARVRDDGGSLPPVTWQQQSGLLAIALILMAAIAVSHQLTPFVTLFALLALVITGLCTARGLPFIMGVLAAGWLMTGASDFAAEGIREIVSSFGHAEQNFGNNLIDGSAFSPGVRLVSNVARVLTGAVGVLAVLGWLRRVWQGYLDLSLTLLWIIPVGLLVASNYGGEILFRIYVFALPFMAFFVAALIFPQPAIAAGLKRLGLVAILSALLALGYAISYYGHERSNYFLPGEVAASEHLVQTAPAGSLLIEITPNYPSRHHRYEQFVQVPLVPWARGNVAESVSIYTLDDIEEMMADRDYPATYIIVTRGQLLELSNPGLESVESILRDIEESHDFAVLYENDAATIYGLADRVGVPPT